MVKPLKEWTYEEVVDECAGLILQKLMVGFFKSGVVEALQLYWNWQVEQKRTK